ncbi:pentapeptide repeat-containing protein [Micromonospora sp. CA-263727]|uniref:pentapeptide repeat-containing protein n=1 Tax=Micromonospora sp. CA-263727 TaxID=3239967 RepID=UPI003D8CE3B4
MFHAPKTWREETIATALASRALLDYRGSLVTLDMIAELKDAADLDGERKSVITAAVRFDWSHFPDGGNFSRTHFAESAIFVGSTWSGDATFADCSFDQEARFTFCVFDSFVDFRRAAFNEMTVFSEARFGVTFPTLVAGSQAITWFGQARFLGKTYFTGVFFAGAADFPDCVFNEETRLGGLVVGGSFFSLSHATVRGNMHVTASAPMVWLDHITVDSGARLYLDLRRAEVSLQHAQLNEDVYLSYWSGEHGTTAMLSDLCVVERLGGSRVADSVHPRLLAVRGTSLARLVLRDVDLWACRFTGARNLSSLTMVGRRLLPRIRGRLRVADEVGWQRSLGRSSGGWADSYNESAMETRLKATTAADSATADMRAELRGIRSALPEPRAQDVQIIYRTLRTLLEGSGDKPGADDFYYGEMEVRRTAPRHEPLTSGWTQHALVWLYYGLSGYGLRASRAFGWFFILLLLGTFGLHVTTTVAPHSTTAATAVAIPGSPRANGTDTGAPALFPDALLSAFQLSTLPLSRTEPLLRYSRPGELVRLCLVVIGPALLTLALIAIRARIRR